MPLPDRPLPACDPRTRTKKSESVGSECESGRQRRSEETKMTQLSQWHLWYAIPLIVGISLVYGATRDESFGAILSHAWRSAIWIVGFMGVIYAALLFAGWGL